jgi:hypothetical protein
MLRPLSRERNDGDENLCGELIHPRRKSMAALCLFLIRAIKAVFAPAGGYRAKRLDIS